MPPRLVYEVSGRQVVFPLEKDEIAIGRDVHNDLVLERPSISRRHARLYRDGDSWRITDLGSAYGTRINDLGHADAVLRDGDKIYLHEFPLTFWDKSVPGATLTARSDSTGSLGVQTVFQSATNFQALATDAADVVHLQRLLRIGAKASEVTLTSKSLDETFQRVLDLIFDHLPVERGFVMLWDGEQDDLVTRCVRQKQGEGTEIQFSRTIAEKVYKDKVAVLTTDAQTDGRFAAGASVIRLGIRSAMAAPLWNRDQVEGLIYVDTPFQTKAFDKFDLDLLSSLGNQVAVAIEQSRLQRSVVEQQVARQRLERYHSPAVVERIKTSGGAPGEALMAEEREATVLFADVVGFTRFCEQMEPKEVARLLNRYFSEMTDKIFLHEGTLDKFIGDCLMAVFGAPIATPDHPRRAVAAALDMREALDRLNEPLPEDERVQFRVGLHSGRVVAGDIGSVRRSDYTVLGATVNVAARLEAGVAKPGQIVISDTTHEAVKGLFETRLVGEHQLKGISRDVCCYEVLGRRERSTTA